MAYTLFLSSFEVPLKFIRSTGHSKPTDVYGCKGIYLPFQLFGVSIEVHAQCVKSVVHRKIFGKFQGVSIRTPASDDDQQPRLIHYNDVIMGAIASQTTSLSIVYSTVNSDADQRKHQSSASLALEWGIHRGPVNSPHKGPVTRKMFPFDEVITILDAITQPSHHTFNDCLTKLALEIRHEWLVTSHYHVECKYWFG